MEPRSYKAKSFTLSRLKGISDKTLEMHFGLYEGYVKNTNLLTQQLFEITFLLDYKPAERGKYIEAFISNLD